MYFMMWYEYHDHEFLYLDEMVEIASSVVIYCSYICNKTLILEV